jgi:hypothetical protein
MCAARLPSCSWLAIYGLKGLHDENMMTVVVLLASNCWQSAGLVHSVLVTCIPWCASNRGVHVACACADMLHVGCVIPGVLELSGLQIPAQSGPLHPEVVLFNRWAVMQRCQRSSLDCSCTA